MLGVGGERQRESVTVFLVHITSSVCVYIYYMCLPCICKHVKQCLCVYTTHVCTCVY